MKEDSSDRKHQHLQQGVAKEPPSYRSIEATAPFPIHCREEEASNARNKSCRRIAERDGLNHSAPCCWISAHNRHKRIATEIWRGGREEGCITFPSDISAELLHGDWCHWSDDNIKSWECKFSLE
jgi:hypothetical protein